MLDSSSNKWLQARALAICITWNYTFAFFHAYRPSCPFGPFIFRQSENHCTVSLSLTIERTLCTHIKSCSINTRSQRFRHSSISRSSKFWNLIFHLKKIYYYCRWLPLYIQFFGYMRSYFKAGEKQACFSRRQRLSLAYRYRKLCSVSDPTKNGWVRNMNVCVSCVHSTAKRTNKEELTHKTKQSRE